MTGPLPRYAIACDFDGTIAADDVGNELFRTFAGPEWKEAVALWKKGFISSRECLERECAASRAGEAELHRFIDSRLLDPTFIPFYRQVRAAGWPLVVVSDGLEYYIKRIFSRYRLGGIPVRSNTLQRPGDRLIPLFPYHRFGCGRCGNCKKHHLDGWRGKGRTLVYIGDGLSDRCAAGRADLVFAKGVLAEFCRENDICYTEFNDFAEISGYLSVSGPDCGQEKVDKLTK